VLARKISATGARRAAIRAEAIAAAKQAMRHQAFEITRLSAVQSAMFDAMLAEMDIRIDIGYRAHDWRAIAPAFFSGGAR
jgi:hypothetical protein